MPRVGEGHVGEDCPRFLSGIQADRSNLELSHLLTGYLDTYLAVLLVLEDQVAQVVLAHQFLESLEVPGVQGGHVVLYHLRR